MNATELHLLERMATAAEGTEEKVSVQSEKVAAILAAMDAESRARAADHAALMAEVRNVRDRTIGKAEARLAGFAALIVVVLAILLLAESRGVDTSAAVQGTTTILGTATEQP